MSGEEKERVDIRVLGHTFPVSADDSHLTQRAADHINARAEFYSGKYDGLSPAQLAALVALDISEELFREREQRTNAKREEDAQWSEAQSRADNLNSRLDTVE